MNKLLLHKAKVACKKLSIDQLYKLAKECKNVRIC